MSHRSGFTLIELLVVVVIIAILAVVAVVTLNPEELLQEARDATRLSDMSTLVNAVSFAVVQEGSGVLGTSNLAYASVPDPSASSTAGDQCQGLGVMTLPSGYSWRCSSASTYQKIDGTGWMPINFQSLGTDSPLSKLPTDPINTTSSGLIYTYTTGGKKFELTAVMESKKYQLGGGTDKVSTDGGQNPFLYETGNNLALSPFSINLWSAGGDFEGSNEGFTTYTGCCGDSSRDTGFPENASSGWTSAYGSVTGADAEYVYEGSQAPVSNTGGIGASSPVLTPGVKYSISFYAKSIANPGPVFANFQNGLADSNCLSFDFTPTAQWQLYGNSCVLDANKSTLFFFSSGWNNNVIPGQKFVIDDLKIQAEP